MKAPFAQYLLSATLTLLVGCSPSLSESYACDLFQNAKCTVRPDGPYIVEPDERLDAALRSWTDFSHHLYFHSRITPGLRVDLSGLGAGERQALARAHCSWTLEDPAAHHRPVGGHMEGIRVDEAGLWCFDYLGTMLLAFVRENQIQSDPVRLEAIFPLRLRLSASVDFVHPDPATERTVELRLPAPR